MSLKKASWLYVFMITSIKWKHYIAKKGDRLHIKMKIGPFSIKRPVFYVINPSLHSAHELYYNYVDAQDIEEATQMMGAGFQMIKNRGSSFLLTWDFNSHRTYWVDITERIEFGNIKHFRVFNDPSEIIARHES